jgi:hypothetical protein
MASSEIIKDLSRSWQVGTSTFSLGKEVTRNRDNEKTVIFNQKKYVESLLQVTYYGHGYSIPPKMHLTT